MTDITTTADLNDRNDGNAVADTAAPVVGALYITAVVEGLVSVPCPVRLQDTPAAVESFETVAVI